MSSTASTLQEFEQQQLTEALQQDFVLDQWLVQPDTNAIKQHENQISRHLEPRLMHLLCFLAANQGKVLSREELVNELWPRVIVNENSLTRAVSELRKCLQVPGQSPKSLIDTIPKKGYRLSQPIDAGVAPSAVESSPLPAFVPSITRIATIAKPQAGLMAILCLGLVLSAWYSSGRVLPAVQFGGDAPVLLSDEVMEPGQDYFAGELTLSSVADEDLLGNAEAPKLSQQGNQYAYIEYDHTGSTIYLGNLDEMTEPVAVFNSADKLYNLAWSPLGNSLLFARISPLTTALYSAAGESELYSLELESLTLRRLIEAPLAPEPESSGGLSLT